MKRMQTFFTYALLIVLFYIFSQIASDMLIKNSYKNVEKDNIKIAKSDNGFEINIEKANSNKQQAYFIGTVKNTSDKVIDKQYVKVDSYYKGKLMQTKYLAFENLKPGEERKFKLLYSVGNIDEYRVSYVDKIPVNTTIIDKAIDAVKDFFSSFNKINIDADGIANDVKNKFEPVHVEGEDWVLFGTVMWIIYAIPEGAIWFIF